MSHLLAERAADYQIVKTKIQLAAQDTTSEQRIGNQWADQVGDNESVEDTISRERERK